MKKEILINIANLLKSLSKKDLDYVLHNILKEYVENMNAAEYRIFKDFANSFTKGDKK